MEEKSVSGITYTKLYKKCLRENICITGLGGTGKSHLLRRLAADFRLNHIFYGITATTGTASVAIGGRTLHSWAGFGLGKGTVEELFELIKENRKALKRWLNVKNLIIDEASMCGSELFTKLSQLGQKIRNNTEPFGGIKVILCFDNLQLKPIREDFFYKSEMWIQFNPVYVRMIIPWRFTDKIYVNLLARVRLGQQTDEDIELLKMRVQAYKDLQKELKEDKNNHKIRVEPTILHSKKLDVEALNLKRLKEINEDEVIFECDDSIVNLYNLKEKSLPGNSSYKELLDKIAPRKLHLKVGAQVMLTYNLDVEEGLCNGSRGVVIEIHEDAQLVTVLFNNGSKMAVSYHAFSFEIDDEKIIRYQIPLILAYCCTIHKIQGATLDSVIVDLGPSVFDANMAYVALSRCRSLNGLYIKVLDEKKIYCDPDALEFEEEIIKKSIPFIFES